MRRQDDVLGIKNKGAGPFMPARWATKDLAYRDPECFTNIKHSDIPVEFEPDTIISYASVELVAPRELDVENIAVSCPARRPLPVCIDAEDGFDYEPAAARTTAVAGCAAGRVATANAFVIGVFGRSPENVRTRLSACHID